MSAANAGLRVYAIRLALGDGTRRPLPLRAFSELIEQRTGYRYDPSAISRIETGHREMVLSDAERFAAVDPKRRGACWLAFGQLPVPRPPVDTTAPI